MGMSLQRRTHIGLSVISDVIKLPLTITDGKITGGGTFELSMGTCNALFNVEAKALFNSEQIGVLFHVQGDLYILVAHYEHTKISSLFIIDKSKSKVSLESMIEPNATLKEAIDGIKHTVVSAFYYKNFEWKKLTLPR